MFDINKQCILYQHDKTTKKLYYNNLIKPTTIMEIHINDKKFVIIALPKSIHFYLSVEVGMNLQLNIQ